MFGLWKYLLRSQHPAGLHSFYWTSSPIHHHFEFICTSDVLVIILNLASNLHLGKKECSPNYYNAIRRDECFDTVSGG